MKYVAVLSTFCWSLISIIGFFFWNWDIAQTVFFINLGFFSLAFNYYAVLTLLSFREHFVDAVKAGKQEGTPVLLIVVIQSFSFLLSQLLFILGLCVAMIITGAFLAAYFYHVFHVETWDEMWGKWDSQWTVIVLTGLGVLVVELVVFFRQFRSFDRHGSSAWSVLSPFTINSKYKITCYLFGSAAVLALEGLLNKEAYFGYLSLGWLFVVNGIWALIDVYYQPALVAEERPPDNGIDPQI